MRIWEFEFINLNLIAMIKDTLNALMRSNALRSRSPPSIRMQDAITPDLEGNRAVKHPF